MRHALIGRLSPVVAVAAVLVPALSAQAIFYVDVTYELRPAAGSPTFLQIGETTSLEVWMKLSSTEPTLPGVMNASFYASLDAGESGIVSYVDGSLTKEPAFYGFNLNATNAPRVGELAATINAQIPGTGVLFVKDVFGRVATFTVHADNPGSIDYLFMNDPPIRPSSVNLSGTNDRMGQLLNVSPLLNITVLPEPSAAALMMLGLGWLIRRRR